MMMHNVNNHV